MKKICRATAPVITRVSFTYRIQYCQYCEMQVTIKFSPTLLIDLLVFTCKLVWLTGVRNNYNAYKIIILVWLYPEIYFKLPHKLLLGGGKFPKGMVRAQVWELVTTIPRQLVANWGRKLGSCFHILRTVR